MVAWIRQVHVYNKIQEVYTFACVSTSYPIYDHPCNLANFTGLLWDKQELVESGDRNQCMQLSLSKWPQYNTNNSTWNSITGLIVNYSIYTHVQNIIEWP